MQSFIDHPSPGQSSPALTRTQLDVLKAGLEASLDEHRGRLQRSEALFRVLTADSSVGGTEREAARRAAEQALASIQEIHRTLEHMAKGRYGFCFQCGLPIPFERLEAVPNTRTCVICPDD